MISFILFVFFFARGNTFENDKEDWHRRIFKENEAVYNRCKIISLYSEQPWNTLPEDVQNEIVYCLVKVMWSESDTSSSLYKVSKNNTCHRMMMMEKEWSEMDAIEKTTAVNCSVRWLGASYLKKNIDPDNSFPISYFYDDEVKKSVMDNVQKCVLIKAQYKQDQKLVFDRFVLTYSINMWRELGLNVSHYRRESIIINEETLKQFQKEVTFMDYITWNNMKDCKVYYSLEKLKPSIWVGIESKSFAALFDKKEDTAQ